MKYHRAPQYSRQTYSNYLWFWGFCFIALALLIPSLSHAKSKSPKVVLAQAKQEPLVEEVKLSGSVISPNIAKLSVQVSGQVKRLAVDLGKHVKAGDKILELDAELETLALAEAKAATEKAIEALNDAKRRLADVKKLSKQQAIPANQLESLSTEVRTDKAELKRVRIQQQLLEAKLQRYTVTAPFDGVISQKLTEMGEWVRPGDAVVELTAMRDLNIDFRVPQSVQTKLNPQADILIQFDAYPEKNFAGDIEWVLPITDIQTRTFRLRAKLNDEKLAIAPGMSARAILQIPSKQQGVTISRDALIRYPDGRIIVWVADQRSDKAKVSERLVKTGLQFDGKIVITEGLSANEWVVVQGNESLRNDMDVIVESANKEG